MRSGLMSVWSFAPQVALLLTDSVRFSDGSATPLCDGRSWSRSCLGSPLVIPVPPRGEGRLWAGSRPLATRFSLQIRLGGFSV